jgi:nucleoside-diphosphate-sugar epimerase
MIIDNRSRGIAPAESGFILMDLTEEKPNFSGIDAVFHLAAKVTGVVHSDEGLTLRDNLQIDLNVIASCIEYHVQRIIYASSCSAEVEQETGYGLAKLTTEKILAKTKELPSVILRLFNVYGPGESFLGDTHVIPELLRKAMWEKEIRVYGDGSQTRPFLYVRDAVDAYVRALTSQTGLLPIDIAGPDQVSIAELLKVIMEETRSQAKISFDLEAPSGPMDVLPDLMKAERVLRWSPRTPIEEGIRKTAEWMRLVHTPSIQ